MAARANEYAIRTLEFVERIQHLDDYEAICAEIEKEMAWFGFTSVTCVGLPAPGERIEDNLFMNTRPEEYIEHYVEKNYVVRDPVVTELRHTLSTYSWSDVRERRDLSKAEENIIDEARDFDTFDGLIVPILTQSGSLSIFGPCGHSPDLSEEARSAVEIIGMYSHQALRRALRRNNDEGSGRKPLTAREKEVMHWVATGKTDDEIADILKISPATVTSHVENAKRKLNAVKRTFAVVQAIRFGELQL